MTPYRKIWELWDAGELVSLHLTEQDAREAREQHLERYRDFPDDGDLVQAAVDLAVSGPRGAQRVAWCAVAEDASTGVADAKTTVDDPEDRGEWPDPDAMPAPTLTEAIHDLRALIAAFDDVRPDDMTALFYIHAYNQLIESGRELLKALETDSTA